MQEPTHSIESLLEHRSWVRALARAVALDPEAAQDLEQDTWLRALQKPPAKRGDGQPGSLRGWLREVLHSRHTDRARKGGREKAKRERLGRELDETGAGVRRRAPGLPDEDALRHETFRALAEAVTALDAPYSETIWLRFIEELDVATVAERLGASATNVHTWTHRGLEQLRERLQVRLGDDWRKRCIVLASPSTMLATGAAGIAGGLVLATLLICAVGAAVVGLYRWQQSHESGGLRSESAVVEPHSNAANDDVGTSKIDATPTRVALAPQPISEPVPASAQSPNPSNAAALPEMTVGTAALLVRIVDEDGQPRLGEDWDVQYVALSPTKGGRGKVDTRSAEVLIESLPSSAVQVTVAFKSEYLVENKRLVAGETTQLEFVVVGRILDRITVSCQVSTGWATPDARHLALIQGDGSRTTAADVQRAGALASGFQSSWHGMVKFPCDKAGPYAIVLDDPAYESLRLDGLDVNMEHTLNLVPAGRLRLSVCRPNDGKPVAFRAYLARAQKGSPFSVKSEISGGDPVAVVPVVPGEYHVRVEVDEFPVFQSILDLSSLSGATQIARTLTLPDPRTLRGLVVDDLGNARARVSVAALLPAILDDSAGSPVASFEQQEHIRSKELRTLIATVTTDEQGRFEFDTLGEAPLVLQAFDGRQASAGTSIDTQTRLLTEPLVLARRGQVFGELEPLVLDGAVVVQSIWAGPIKQTGALTRFHGARAVRIAFPGVPGLGSSFELDLPPGRWMLSQHEGSGKRARKQHALLGEVEVRSGVRSEFRLKDCDAGRVSLEVECLDSSMRALVGCVRLWNDTWGDSQFTRRGGKVTFARLEPGTYEVRFHDSDSSAPPSPAPTQVRVTQVGQTHQLIIPARQFGTLSVRAEGVRVNESTLVRVTSAVGSPRRTVEATLGPDGVCVFSKLDRGSYRVTARDATGSWFAAHSGPVEVGVEQLTAVVMDCALMRGRVLCLELETDEPMRDQLVHLCPGSVAKRSPLSSQTDEDGYLEIELTAGVWSIYGSRGRSHSAVVTWPPTIPLRF